MKHPNFREEKKLYKKGYKKVVGIDESGRGPLAGPVIACAITVPEFLISNFKFLKIKDSKQLTAKQREEIYKLLKKDSGVQWGIGRVSEKVIDRINIFQATKLAMQRAVKNLEKKQANIDFLIIDGSFEIKCPISQKSIIKADEKVFSVAAASIIAKVFRDKMMINYHKKFPEYCFNRHKGYPTKQHKQVIKQHGSCCLHRQTFHLS
ncbi:ribonuclease HII [Parcubacteria bacterium DG_72]|nr:MAG: ribonuclease HII [Parcubacteria bacterium DG_72]